MLDMVGNLHTVKKSKSDWIVVDETHENIVSKELFEQVASRMKEYKEFIPSASERNPLRRKVICGTCGFAMSLSNTKNAKYHCRTSHLETGFDCTTEGILQADIHEMVEGKNQTQRIVIYYRFVGYVEIPEVSHRPNIVADTRKGVATKYLTEPKTA